MIIPKKVSKGQITNKKLVKIKNNMKRKKK